MFRRRRSPIESRHDPGGVPRRPGRTSSPRPSPEHPATTPSEPNSGTRGTSSPTLSSRSSDPTGRTTGRLDCAHGTIPYAPWGHTPIDEVRNDLCHNPSRPRRRNALPECDVQQWYLMMLEVAEGETSMTDQSSAQRRVHSEHFWPILQAGRRSVPWRPRTYPSVLPCCASWLARHCRGSRVTPDSRDARCRSTRSTSG